MTSSRPIALGLALVVSACASGEVERSRDRPPKEHTPPRARELPGPSQAICEPKHCPIFCVRIEGCVAQAECLTQCQEVCGDGYFDDRDGPVMACVAGASGDACVAMRGCCETDFTSQICRWQRQLGTRSSGGAPQARSSPKRAAEGAGPRAIRRALGEANPSRIDEGARIGDKPGP